MAELILIPFLWLTEETEQRSITKLYRQPCLAGYRIAMIKSERQAGNQQISRKCLGKAKGNTLPSRKRRIICNSKISLIGEGS